MWLGEQQKFASIKVHFYFCSMTNTFCEGLSIETGLQNLHNYTNAEHTSVTSRECGYLSSAHVNNEFLLQLQPPACQ